MTAEQHARIRVRQRRRREFGRHLVLGLIAFILVAPFYYVLLASLKDSTEIFSYPPKLLPIPPYFGNYRDLLWNTGFLRWMFNTLFVATSVTVLKVFLDSMAGYALAKIEFTGRRLVFLLMVILLMVPIGALIVPLWSMVSGLGLINTYWALILPPLANPLGAILMRQFILGLPRDLENAARLDGLSEFAIYWRIVLPLIKPGLVVLAVIIFTDQFMSFTWPLIATTSDELQVLTVGIAALRAHGGANYGVWSASAVMSLVPIGVFFFVLQRQFLARSLAGALKQ
ncbi:carbohydrate ABC transporter permease [Aestuariivirga sp. YIM B02566]|uniref:Carbohydrate ABC transporter permease n=1 Tax=Taklimakanibacter albus TaxID=2800327 RepID=A0ACC5RA90_9HYPH|nr:carbohydrate ABC transporter permease [Aestuariivirga sp. YIM B02566]MBK1869578.1 carbohydrate ABC transporter permease [Aestuariivirga sp. YIM B02566]